VRLLRLFRLPARRFLDAEVHQHTCWTRLTGNNLKLTWGAHMSYAARVGQRSAKGAQRRRNAAGSGSSPSSGSGPTASGSSGSKGGGSSFPTWAVVVIVLLALALISVGAGELDWF